MAGITAVINHELANSWARAGRRNGHATGGMDMVRSCSDPPYRACPCGIPEVHTSTKGDGSRVNRLDLGVSPALDCGGNRKCCHAGPRAPILHDRSCPPCQGGSASNRYYPRRAFLAREPFLVRSPTVTPEERRGGNAQAQASALEEEACRTGSTSPVSPQRATSAVSPLRSCARELGALDVASGK
jgi:hypothetical protein